MEKILKVICICLGIMVLRDGYTAETPDVKSKLNLTESVSFTDEIYGKRKFALGNENIAMNYPNPFSSTTTIYYNISIAGNVTLTIYNLLGGEVCRYDEGFKGIGESEKIAELSFLSSGVYIYEIKTDSRRIAINKFMILK